MSKHTTGPWVDYGFHEDGIDGERIIAQIGGHERGYAVACVLPCGEPDTDPQLTEANARLIATAPELLSALTEAFVRLKEIETCNDISIPYELREAARSAIAKATGK